MTETVSPFFLSKYLSNILIRLQKYVNDVGLIQKCSVYLTIPDGTFSFPERVPSAAEPIVPTSIEIVPEQDSFRRNLFPGFFHFLRFFFLEDNFHVLY